MLQNDVLVCVPWRDRGNVNRTRALRYVVSNLKLSTGLPVTLVDGKRIKFSLSAARNAAVDLAKEQGKSVVVICDADTLINHTSIMNAIELARTTESVVLPYTLVRYLTQRGTEKVLSNKLPPDEAPDLASFDWSVGGAFVTRPEVWDALGGQDEQFTGWGCEDTAFSIVAERMGRSHMRVEGIMNHLWHPSAEKETDPAYYFNAELLKKYGETDSIEDMVDENRKRRND